jgi:hypothetical protein
MKVEVYDLIPRINDAEVDYCADHMGMRFSEAYAVAEDEAARAEDLVPFVVDVAPRALGVESEDVWQAIEEYLTDCGIDVSVLELDDMQWTEVDEDEEEEKITE